jgi:hypothetical protein
VTLHSKYTGGLTLQKFSPDVAEADALYRTVLAQVGGLF